MNSRDVIRRLNAYAEGRPLERGSTMHLAIAEDEDLLALAFVRMGGESLPWALGTCRPGEEPWVIAVPDARGRERVGGMMVELTPRLAGFLDSPMFSGSGVTTADSPEDLPLRQIWTPNGSHVQMLHMLNLRYTFARAGDPDRARVLRALGRASGYLFREAALPGQATIIDATAALREAFTFPTDDLRQQHLGLLLALLTTPGSPEQRFAAAELAEREPVSMSLDPGLERQTLEPLVERFTAARRAEDAEGMDAAETEITAVLTAEVEHRLRLTLEAVSLLRSDRRPVNAGAVELASTSTKDRQWQYLRLEEELVADGEDNGHFPPSPETDRGRATGAARYHRMTGADEERAAALIHDDAELQEEAVAAGDGLRGEIVRVEDRSPSGSSAVTPVWTVAAPAAAPTRIRKGSSVCVAGMPSRSGTVLAVTREDERRLVEVEIRNWKKRPDARRHPRFAAVPAAADSSLEGETVTLLPSSMGGLARLKRRRIHDQSGAGAWATHGAGSAPPANGGGGGDLLGEVEELRRSRA